MDALVGQVHLPADIQSMSERDFLAKTNVELAFGLTRDEAIARRLLHGVNRVTPPVNCPSWVCCLLPCILRTETMRMYTNNCPKEVTVVRSGKKLCMDAASLVFGDVVVFKAGDIIAADCRLLECSEDFEVDMTNLANEKNPRKGTTECTDKEHGLLSRNMVFMSTTITKGDAVGVVVATGDNSIWGQLISNHKWPADASQPSESERFIANKV